MSKRANDAIDPAAYALRKFIERSRVKLTSMPNWEKEFLSSYMNRGEAPASGRQLEHRRKKGGVRGTVPDARRNLVRRGQPQL
jgi:hypothetical protein